MAAALATCLLAALAFAAAQSPAAVLRVHTAKRSATHKPLPYCTRKRRHHCRHRRAAHHPLAPAAGVALPGAIGGQIGSTGAPGAGTIGVPGPETPSSRLAAPELTVSGGTLHWRAVAGVSAYEVVTRVPGQSARFSTVSTNSFTPTPVPGVTVKYSVRTDVAGSSWAPDVSISFQAFQPGMNAGWVYTGQLDTQAVSKLGARVVRVNFPIEWTAAQLKPTIAGYASMGVRVAPLASFDGRIPSSAEARALASWAKAYGPGGTFWAGQSDGNLAIQTIEFGNETSGGYQYGDGAGAPSYMARARAYATLIKEAAQAISATGIPVGMLAVSEDWTGDWMKEMFAAVPNLGSYIGGWVSHPYGTQWKYKLENIIKQSAEHGASSSLPIDITEWGVASDNGRCLSENYGYNPCMSYQEAAETLRSVTGAIRSYLGPRLGLYLFYQARDQAVSGASTEREGYFGLLQHALQLKGAYTTAAQEVLKG